MAGWIKLHRSVLENPVVMKDADHLAVWVWLLLKVTHNGVDVMFKGERRTLKPGEWTLGRKEIADELQISESKVTRILKLFESEHQIEQQTSNKCRLISIVNWDKYQQSEQQSEQQVNNNRTTSEQQVNTKQECKNEKNEKNVKKTIYAQVPVELVEPLKAFEKHRNKLKAPLTDHALELIVKKVRKLADGNTQVMIDILNQSIENGWKGVFELPASKGKRRNEVLDILESGVLDDD